MIEVKNPQNWKWQLANSITTVEKLSKIIKLSEREQQNIKTCLEKFKMAITPYYASLIEPDNPICPIRLQAVPSIEETAPDIFAMKDPLDEDANSPTPSLIYRYPDRAVLLVTMECSMYCRHCNRRRIVGHNDKVITDDALKNALAYIEATPQIRDVLVSGGDPFMLSTEKLEYIISSIRAIKHVEIIRIGTRVPVVMPMRVTEELVEMLKQYHPLWINTHFNHPREITGESQKACSLLADAGIPLGNQSVLLKGVNDNAEIMKELLLKLVKMRVRPYYLFQCDLSIGTGHFRTNIDVGVNIIRDLTGAISGYAIPKFVVDAPGGGGKVPLNHNYITLRDDKEIVFKNYLGDSYRYPVG